MAFIFILFAIGPLLFLHHRNSLKSASLQPESAARPETYARHSRLTNDQDHILLGNIAAVPFQELYDLLARKSPNEIAALARQLQNLPPGGIANARITAFYQAWAALDAPAASRFALSMKSLDSRSAAFAAIIEGADPESAGKVVRLLLAAPANTLPLLAREQILDKGVVKWSLADPAGATAFLAEMYPDAAERLADLSKGPPPGNLMNTVGQVAQNWGATDPQAALAWALGKSGEQRNMAFQSVVMGWWQIDPEAAQSYVAAHTDTLMGKQTASALANRIATIDPKAALQWISQLSPEGRSFTTPSIASGWAANDPQGAGEWALNLPAGEREGAIQTVTMVWALRDPEAAAQWIGSLQGESRDAAAGSYGSTVALKDPGAGLDWAMSISDPARREQVLTPIVNNWLRSDPAAAKTWIQNSSLPDAEKTRLLGPVLGQ